ncbi:MAG TPA: (d)CMP kinase [Casimicrobiaceae bacterium]|nr:(d)CMP kinase [Casimicrobiaceae bacterium]
MADGVPVIAIDGPAASGKGTVARRVAEALRWHYLDSGALYRLVALEALDERVDVDDAVALSGLARTLDVLFADDRLQLDGRDVTERVRDEDVSAAASRVAIHPGVREALLARQRAFLQAPGLVAEGRDMGSVVFREAPLKVYVTASAEERAQRRGRQLAEKGIDVNIQSLLRDIQDRDARDARREAAPLKAVAGALILDTTNMTVDAVVGAVLNAARAAGLSAAR